MADEGYYIIISNSEERDRKDLFDLNFSEYKFMEIGKPIKFIVIYEKDIKFEKFSLYICFKKKAWEKSKKVIPVVEEKNTEKRKNNLYIYLIW